MAIGVRSERGSLTSPLDRPWRISTARCRQMIEAGSIRESDRVSLWKGRIVEKWGKNPRHLTAVLMLAQVVTALLPDGFHARPEQPIEIPDDGMPEPDLAIVRGRIRNFSRQTPASRDVVLIVEVADSSLAEDRGDKLSTYAAEAIPTYWIVNLRGARIEVYSDPTGPADHPRYRQSFAFGRSEEVPVILDGREVGHVAVKDVLP